MSILKKIGFYRKKPFSAWQIELTTRCLLRCRMCVKEAGSDWARRDMDFEDFKKITPYLRRVERVVLEGWGESLLYPRLMDCIRLVTKEGAKAGFVTSGTGLDEARSEALLESGLDFIGFSLSGATAGTHEAIRAGSGFESLVASIHMFQAVRKRKRAPGPSMHIVYLMLRENIEEVPALVGLAKELGIKKVALVNAILISNREQDEGRVFAEGRAVPRYADILKEAAAVAARTGIELVMAPLSSGEVGVCGEDPLRNLYISVQGEVSPCVYLFPPVNAPFRRIHFGKESCTDKVSFGNIFRQPFPEIWNNRAYSDFRKCFQERERIMKTVRQDFFGLAPEGSSEYSEQMPEPPGPCRTCHKLSGL